MPSTSLKQHKFMEAVAHNAAFAKKAGVPQSVGQDYSAADKGKKFGKGGSTRADVQRVNEPKTHHGDMALFKKGGDTMASKMNPGFMAMMAKKKDGAKAEMPMKKGGPAKKMASGGFTRAADGIASKGKTKAKQIKMASGGKAC